MRVIWYDDRFRNKEISKCISNKYFGSGIIFVHPDKICGLVAHYSPRDYEKAKAWVDAHNQIVNSPLFKALEG